MPAPGTFGGGRKFIMLVSSGPTERTFGCPFVVIAERLFPFLDKEFGSMSPEFGSNTMPACAAIMPPSVLGTIKAFAPQPVAEVDPSLQMKSPNNAVRSPVRSAAVGTVVVTDASRRRLSP